MNKESTELQAWHMLGAQKTLTVSPWRWSCFLFVPKSVKVFEQ